MRRSDAALGGAPAIPVPTGSCDRSEPLGAELARAEDDLRSLSIEILERYEEASLIYRLSERLAEHVDAAGIATTLLAEVADVLGAVEGEVWLQGAAGLGVAAALPPGVGLAGAAEPEVLHVIARGRPWLRETDGRIPPAVAVPLPGGEAGSLGALVLRGRSDGRSYGSGDIKLLGSLGTLASAFIRNGRLAAEVRRADARRREDEIARQVHLGLLPRTDPGVPGLDVAGACLAAGNVGGDYYGWLEAPEGAFGVVLADVSGHGIAAALVMAASKGALRAEARHTGSPAELLRRANEVLVPELSDADLFATAFVARVSPGGRQLVAAGAGHPPALLLRVSGAVETLGAGGPALGVLPDAAYEEQTRALAPGDVLVAYTDGLVEARDAERRPFGTERLIEALREARAERAAEVRRRVLVRLEDHLAGAGLADDVTLVVVRVVEEGGA